MAVSLPSFGGRVRSMGYFALEGGCPHRGQAEVHAGIPGVGGQADDRMKGGGLGGRTEVAAGSVWSTLRNELVDHERFARRGEAWAAIFECIEVLYNRQRPHIAIGYVSPELFEASRRRYTQPVHQIWASSAGLWCEASYYVANRM